MKEIFNQVIGLDTSMTELDYETRDLLKVMFIKDWARYPSQERESIRIKIDSDRVLNAFEDWLEGYSGGGLIEVRQVGNTFLLRRRKMEEMGLFVYYESRN